jgi:hypothetical protein
MSSFSFLFAVAATLLLLLVVGAPASAEVAAPVTADVPLYALWSGLTSTFVNISTIDASTGMGFLHPSPHLSSKLYSTLLYSTLYSFFAGTQGPLLYTTTEWVMFFPVTPAVDHQGKRLFTPLLSVAVRRLTLAVVV